MSLWRLNIFKLLLLFQLYVLSEMTLLFIGCLFIEIIHAYPSLVSNCLTYIESVFKSN